MEPSPATAPKHRSLLGKLKHPSSFSKPQLALFILAFGLIGYLIYHAFAAAPLIASVQGEQMTPQLASAPGANSRISESGSAQIVLASSTTFSNLTKPTLSGSPIVGSTLKVNNGTWSPTPTSYLYAWWRCGSSGNNCIHSPTSSNQNTYAIQSGDVGYTIKAQVAPNGAWTYSKSSAPSAVVTVPVATGSFTNLTKPTLSGSTTVGSTLTAGNGSWNPAPSSYRYAWWRCDSSGNNCIHSPTATNSTLNTYSIQSGDVSYTIMVQVAPNGQWSDSASSPPSAVITSPLNYSIVADSSASGGKAAKFGGGVQINGPVSLSAVGNTLTVTARADQCGSSWPLLAVAVDGANYISSTVNNTAWSSYSATVNLAAGNHQLSITNKGGSGCNLYVDITRFYGAAPVTPPPTVALSASPTSVSSGQSSTLTWTSTNATSCLASGAWSGSEPTSGSTSTGALNQTSTYSLSCTGAGGTATASVSVTVVSVPVNSYGGTPGIGLNQQGGSLGLIINPSLYSLVIADNADHLSTIENVAGRGLVYFNGTDVKQTFSTGVTYTQALNNGWLLMCGTGYCMNSQFSSYGVDLGSSAYQQAWISNVLAYLAAHPGIDGIFIDNVLYDPKGDFGGVYPNKYPSTASWAAATTSFVKAVYPALHAKGYYVALNGGAYKSGDSTYNDGTSTVNWWNTIGPYSSGLMNENYMETQNGLRANGTAWYQDWSGWQRLIGTAQSLGKDFIGLMHSTNCTNTTWMTYGKASFLLEWNGGGSVYIYSGGQCDPTNSAWTTSIGTPSAAKVQVGVGWMRTYTKGTVLVNPSPTASQTFSVNGTSYTLAPTTARIL